MLQNELKLFLLYCRRYWGSLSIYLKTLKTDLKYLNVHRWSAFQIRVGMELLVVQ